MYAKIVRLLIAGIVLAGFMVIPPAGQAAHASSLVGPKRFYLVLGDSLAFGYQPNLDWSHGYNTYFFTDLQTHGAGTMVNLACPGETSATFISGGCPHAALRKTLYSGSQLQAALNYIRAHSQQVSPVTIDIGANDLLPLLNDTTCAAPSPGQLAGALSVFDTNFKNILGQLKSALNGSGDLLAMNYYNPYENECPNLIASAQQFNLDLQNDAATLGVPVADVFASFGGATVPNPNICTYTWICAKAHDIHATRTGYQVIASAFESVAGY